MAVQPMEFLRRHGAKRMRARGEHPAPDPPGDGVGADDPAGPRVEHGLERAPDDWCPIDPGPARADDLEADGVPRRFVDGSQIHQTVGWARGPDGHPVPLELAEIGGICMHSHGRKLVRECEVVERILCMIVDPFPWEEVESFAGELAHLGLRLLPARPPEDGDGVPRLSFTFERMRKQTTIACRHEMEALEEVAWAKNASEPTLVDGRLTRFQHRAVERSDVVGVIKRQHADYLHEPGWRAFYALEPGQRTPAFLLSSRNLVVASWYLKLDGAGGSMPDWGVVRVEIPAKRFIEAGSDFDHIDRLSRALVRMRCRGQGYDRAPVSLEPIVRAEQSLQSLLAPMPWLVERFYRLTGL